MIVLVLSFIQWNFLTPPRWVGLANFSTMVRDDHVFHALLISATTCSGTSRCRPRRPWPGHAAGQEDAAMGLFRALYVLSFMSTPVAMAVVWSGCSTRRTLIDHLLSLAGCTGRTGSATPAPRCPWSPW